MRHPTEGVLRRLLDEPAGVADSDREHVAGCPQCLSDAGRHPRGRRPRRRGAGDRRRRRTSMSPPRGGACRRPRPRRDRAGRRTPRAGRSRAVLRRPAVAALAVAVVLAGAGTAAANDWLQIFRTEQVAPVSISTDRPHRAARPQRVRRARGDRRPGRARGPRCGGRGGRDRSRRAGGHRPAARGQRRAGLPGGRQGERHLHLLGGARRPGRRRGRDDAAASSAGPGRELGAAGRRPGRGPGVVVLRRRARPRRRSRRRADGVLLRRPVRDGARLPAVAARPARRRRRAAAHVHRGRRHPAAARARGRGHHVLGAGRRRARHGAGDP